MTLCHINTGHVCKLLQWLGFHLITTRFDTHVARCFFCLLEMAFIKSAISNVHGFRSSLEPFPLVAVVLSEVALICFSVNKKFTHILLLRTPIFWIRSIPSLLKQNKNLSTGVLWMVLVDKTLTVVKSSDFKKGKTCILFLKIGRSPHNLLGEGKTTKLFFSVIVTYCEMLEEPCSHDICCYFGKNAPFLLAFFVLVWIIIVTCARWSYAVV